MKNWLWIISILLSTAFIEASDSITIESSDFTTGNNFYIGGRFSTTAASPISIDVKIDGATQGGTPPLVQNAPANAGNWSAYVSPAGFGIGPHSIDVTLLSGATVLATASGSITYSAVSPHVYARQANQFFSDGTYGISIYFPADSSESLFVPGLSNVLLMPTGYLASTATNLKSLNITLVGNLDGTNETLGFQSGVVAPSGTTIGAYSTATKSIAITANVPATGVTPSAFTSALQLLIYNNALSAPTPGIRTIRVFAVDINGQTSSEAIANLTVSRGRPEVALSGNSATPNTTANYQQNSGALAIVPNAVIDAQTPAWVPGPYVSGPAPNYTPPYFYLMTAGNNVTEYKGQVIDQIDVVLSNTSPGSPALQSQEAIDFAFPTEYAYQYDKGHFLIYDGFYDSTLAGMLKGPYPMFSARAALVGSTASTKTYRVSVTQDPASQFATLKQTPAPIVPMPVSFAQNLLKSMTYSNSNTNPSGNGVSRRITVSVTNASTSPVSRTSVLRACDVTIIPTNSTPSCVYSGGALTVDQNSASVPSSLPVSGFVIGDPDGNNYGAAGSALPSKPETLTVIASNGTLRYTGALADVSVVSGNNTETLVLNGPVNGNAGTLTQVFSANRITYTPNVGFSGTDTIKVILNDNGNSSTNQNTNSPLALTATATASVTVTKVNQPTVIIAPAARATSSGQLHVITTINQSDPDISAASGTLVQLSMRANNGLLSLASTSGLNFSFSDVDGTGIGTGSNDTQFVCRGSTVNLALALAEVSYRSNPNYYGVDVINIQVNDLGSSGVRRAGYIAGAISAGGSSNSLITTSTTLMNVTFANAAPSVVANTSLTVPIGASVTLAGGVYTIPSNYPPAITRLPTSYLTPLPVGAGTAVAGGSNLVAQDVETKQASGLTYTINLPVTQGTLRLQRPSVAPVTLIAGSQFTQDDLNNGYVSYSHNGSLSGDDGFVFTVTDDNATTAPSNAPSGQVNGTTSQQIFNLTIDRTQPIAIFNGSTVATFQEPVAPAAAVPVLIDNDPLTRVVNATDITNFVTVGNTGRLTATVVIPTQAGVNPGTVSSDPLDTLTIRDQPPIGFTGTQLFYNGSPIGSYSGGQGTPLVVTLSSALPISVSAVSELLRHIEYSNPGANPSASQRIVTVTVLNGAGQSSMVASKAVNVVPYNDAPVITPPARPLVLVPGLTLGASVQATDPDGVLSYALSGSPPTRGLVTVDAVTGAYTYTPAPNAFGLGGALTDQFEITATDPGILTDPVSKTATQLYQVRITDLGAAAPVFTSNPPLETVLGRVLTYAPQVNASGIPGGGNLVFSLVGAPAIDPGLGFDPATGTITWPANWTTTPAPTADSYQQFGLLVVDQSTDVAAYQPILLKVLLTPQGSN